MTAAGDVLAAPCCLLLSLISALSPLPPWGELSACVSALQAWGGVGSREELMLPKA